MKKLINKKDLLLISGILLLAVGIFAWQHFATDTTIEEDRLFAEISFHGQIIYIAYLDEGYDREFVLPQHPGVRFAIQDNRISFLSADCPDQVCIMMGWQGPGGFAACLPNGLLLFVYGSSDTGIDVIAQCCSDFYF